MSKLFWSLALAALLGIGVWTGVKASTGTGKNLQIEPASTSEPSDINSSNDPCCPPDCCPDCPPCPFCQ